MEVFRMSESQVAMKRCNPAELQFVQKNLLQGFNERSLPLSDFQRHRKEYLYPWPLILKDEAREAREERKDREERGDQLSSFVSASKVRASLNTLVESLSCHIRGSPS